MSNPKFEEGQRRARDEAKARHRKEVRFWKGLMLATLAWGILGFSLAVYFWTEARKPWRTGTPPKLERLTIVTEGYAGKDGSWRSWDTGEKIEVTQWKP